MIPLNLNQCKHIVREALHEDAAHKDITTRLLISKTSRSVAKVIIKEPAVLCGLPLLKLVFQMLDINIRVTFHHKDGEKVKANTTVATIRGRTAPILTGERTALNFLGCLSGVATLTRLYVDKIKPYKAQILETRKTTPGFRLLEKYAVRCGGGVNHRFDLSELVFIKDNHLAAGNEGDSIIDIIQKVRQKTKTPVCVEVDNLVQLKEALAAAPDIILLDNMRPAQVKQAVKLRSASATRVKKILLEASGGITLRTIRAYAQTGIDRISVGALTHSYHSVNVSLDFVS